MSKFDNVRELLDRYGERVDIIVLGETWLKDDKAVLYSIKGYKGYFSCRDSSHGGLALFVRQDMHYDLCSNRNVDGFHHIHLQLQTKGRHLQIHAVYRPPSFDARRFFSEIETMLSSGSSNHDRLILGDMNVPVNIVTNNIALEYIRLLESYHAFLTNTMVTRKASGNILDHVVCSGQIVDNIINETVYNDLSDHCFIVTNVELRHEVSKQIFTKNVIDHARLNELFAQNSTQIPPDCDANGKLEHVIRTYNSLLTQCTKKVTLKTKLKGHCPWMTYDLIRLIRIKENALGRYHRNPDDVAIKETLQYASKLVQRKKAQCKSDYYYKQLERADARTAWRFVNSNLGKQPNINKISAISVNDRLVSDNSHICSAFNDFFCSVGSSLAAKINSDRNIVRSFPKEILYT